MPRLPIAICFAALWTVSAAAKGVPPSQAEARCPPEEISSACAARMIIGGEGLAEELRMGLHGELTPVSEITLRAALEAYLAERAAWGEQQAWEELAFPILALAAPGETPVVASQDLEAALGELLEQRQSWGAHPVQVAGAAEPTASPSDTEAALKALLAERESWGTQPAQTTAAPAAAPAQTAPNAAAAATPESTGTALKALLKERTSWGTQPAQATAAPADAPAKAAISTSTAPESNEAALKALLKQRESWGTKPSKTAAVPAAPVSSAQGCEAKLRSIAAEGTIRFESASATLDPESQPTLDRIATAANECGRVGIRIEGHTDDTGTARTNQTLSQQRAQAVAGYLAKAGVEAKRLQATGFGETKPLVANDTAENRAKNRRIEFSVR